MKNPFELFRQKNRRNILIQAAIIGLSTAALACAVLLLTAKICDFSIGYCLLGLAALPIGAGLFLLFKRSSAMQFAKTLDNEFCLHEKVQTMIAFEHSGEEMVKIQREDTMQKLDAVARKNLRFRRPWLYALLPILAAALMVTAIAYPEKPDEPYVEPPEPPAQITDWEWAALDDLIDYVKNSEADETYMKPNTLRALYALKNLLLDGVAESSLHGVVTTTVTAVNNARQTAENELDETQTYQMQVNEAVCEYTVSKLYEIFKIDAATDDPIDPDQGDDTGDDDDPNSSWDGSGELNMGADDKLFDALLGYVAYGDVIADYQTQINRAFVNGVLTQEQYDYLMAYFGYLYGGND